jgi:hypothetical protein
MSPKPEPVTVRDMVSQLRGERELADALIELINRGFLSVESFGGNEEEHRFRITRRGHAARKASEQR